MITNAEKAALLWNRFKNEDSSFELFTSGSTGVPKSILLHRELMEQSAKRSITALDLQKNDRFLIPLSIETAGGFMLLYRAFLLGAAYEAMEPQADPLSVIAEDHPFTITSLVPYQLHQIMQDETSLQKLARFRTILIGGAALSEVYLEKLAAFSHTHFFHTYGMTETYSHIALKSLNLEKETHFRTLPGITVSKDSEGRLIIHGFSSTPVQTNDLAVIHSDTAFDILGRFDDMINSGAIKIQASKVEAALKSTTYLKDLSLFVQGIPDEQLGEKVAAFIEGKQPEEKVLQAIKEELRESLSPYEIPKSFYFLPQFSYTESLKIDKRKTSDDFLKNR